jgi:uncharacterized protein (UPF0332 family)
MEQERGISLVAPNENLADSYMAKAQESIEVMRTLEDKSQAWAASACYYSMYYSLYAVLMRVGIKSEIHSCSLAAMRYALPDLYDKKDEALIERAFKMRIDHQYYVKKVPSSLLLDDLFDGAVQFFEKSQKSLAKINENYINTVRMKMQTLRNKTR